MTTRLGFWDYKGITLLIFLTSQGHDLPTLDFKRPCLCVITTTTITRSETLSPTPLNSESQTSIPVRSACSRSSVSENNRKHTRYNDITLNFGLTPPQKTPPANEAASAHCFASLQFWTAAEYLYCYCARLRIEAYGPRFRVEDFGLYGLGLAAFLRCMA